MTRALYDQDAYRSGCPAQVVRVHDGDVELDQTVFYPLGGGQPGDSGWIGRADGTRLRITDTRRDKASGAILHRLDAGVPPPAAGSTVTLELDWARRHRHMRMHSALHLLSAVIRHGVTGGNLTHESGRLDFDTGGEALDATRIQHELERLVQADLPVSMRMIRGEELAAQPELIRTLSVTPPMHLPWIRLVEIEGADLQPCGGTHVRRTGEIGALRVLKIESKGARNRRVVLAFAEDA